MSGNAPISRVAVAAVVGSVIPPVGIVLGFIALILISDGQGAVRGKALAVLALFLSIVVVPLCVLFAFIIQDLRFF